MKKLLASITLSLLLISTSFAGLKAQWDDPDNEPGSIIEYRVYRIAADGTRSLIATKLAPTPHQASDIEVEVILPAGPSTLVVQAVNNAGLTSEDSEPAQVVVPHAPKGLRIVLEVATP